MEPAEPPTGTPETSRNGWQWTVVRPWNRDAYIIAVHDRATSKHAFYEMSGLVAHRLPASRLPDALAVIVEDLTLTLEDHIGQR